MQLSETITRTEIKSESRTVSKNATGARGIHNDDD